MELKWAVTAIIGILPAVLRVWLAAIWQRMNDNLGVLNADIILATGTPAIFWNDFPKSGIYSALVTWQFFVV